LIVAALWVVVVSGLWFALGGPLGWLFQLDGVALQLVFRFAGPLSLLWFFNGMIFVSNAACNNLGHPFYSTWVNWGRHTIGTVPFVMVFAWWLGAPGVLIGQALGGVVFGLIAGVIAAKVIATGADDTRPPFLRQLRMFQIFHDRH